MTKARDLANIGTTLATVSTTELGYLDGVTSAIQTQIDGKQAANAAVSTTELGYLDGVTSAIQTQLDGKSGTSHNHDSTYIAKTLTTTTGDMIYASSANTPARLAIGSSSQVLTVSGGVPTWATPAGGGKVLQVVVASDTTQTTTTSTTNVTTGLSASITPASTSNKVLVQVLMHGSCQYNGALTEASSNFVLRYTNTTTDLIDHGLALKIGSSGAVPEITSGVVFGILHSPASTSSLTYEVFMRSNTGGTSTTTFQRSGAVIILMEIAA